MFFSRHLVMVAQEHGEQAAVATVARVGRTVAIWGALIGSTALAAMLFLSHRLGVQSLVVIPLIALDAYTSYVADVGRAFFQSVRRTVSLGLYNLVWMTFRLIFCLIGVYVFRDAFGALLGIVASAVVAYLVFRVWIARRLSTANDAVPLPRVWALLPSIFGYGLLIAISNLDILLTYLVLTDGTLGTYAASSIFPKAMMVVTLPLVQILFPGMMGSKPSDRGSQNFALKSGLALAIITGGGVVAIWLMSQYLCGGKWGVKLCDPLLLYPMLFSVVPLSLLRVLVLLQFARHRDWFASWLVVPTVVFVFAAGSGHWNASNLAVAFSIFTTASLVFLFTVHFATERLRPAGSH
jgi:O-antigen/teichoic acid export membrane protein